LDFEDSEDFASEEEEEVTFASEDEGENISDAEDWIGRARTARLRLEILN
jgi:hypothetical protein